MTPVDWDQIYTTYSGKVMGYIMARLQCRADAEDLCATVFEKAFRKWNEYDKDKAAVGTWIYAITRNTVIDFYRKSRPAAELDENMPSDEAVDDGLLHEETLSELATAMKSLPPDLQDIVVLLYYDRKPMTEIARILHLSYGVVKLRHQKALAILRKSLGI